MLFCKLHYIIITTIHEGELPPIILKIALFLKFISVSDPKKVLHTAIILFKDETQLVTWNISALVVLTPLTKISPRSSRTNPHSARIFLVASGTWIRPLTPVLSMRLARLTVEPQISYCGLVAPITPATTGPWAMPVSHPKQMKRRLNITSALLLKCVLPSFCFLSPKCERTCVRVSTLQLTNTQLKAFGGVSVNFF